MIQMKTKVVLCFIQTHLNHPPPHFGVRDLGKFDPEQTVQTTGKKGDVWFWTPDLWHGKSEFK